MLWKITSTLYLVTCWSRALTSEAAQTFTADFSSAYLSRFLKEDHGHTLVKSHWLQRVLRPCVRITLGDSEQSIFQAHRRAPKKKTTWLNTLPKLGCIRLSCVTECWLCTTVSSSPLRIGPGFVQDSEPALPLGPGPSPLVVPAELLGSGPFLPRAILWPGMGIKLSELQFGE